jgi:hypothetical protein
MATPHVAGAIAAIRSACPTATATNIENALISTGTPIHDGRSGGSITKNRIRVDLAVQQVCGAGTAKAAITSPAPGSTLGSSATFQWSAGTGVTQYWLSIGTTGAGSTNVYNQTAGTALSAAVNNLPATGGTIYVRLWSLILGSWQFNDYTYTGGVAAVLTTPTPGSTIGTSSAFFGWTAGTGVSQYWLTIGTTGVGSSNVFNQSTATNLSITVNGLPLNGGTLYVRLWSLMGAVWQSRDYTYTMAANIAALTTPAPGSTLQSSSVTFGWTAGSGVSQYWLTVGTTGVGSQDVFNQSTGTSLSTTVNNIPLTGGTIYVRLWSLTGATWRSNDYTYSTSAHIATMTSPTPGTTLGGATVNFQWSTGSGVSQYWLTVGTTGVGSKDILNLSTGTSTSRSVTVPLSGGTVYVRLWSLIGSTWSYADYTYATWGQNAAMTSPTPTATLAGSSVSFGWTAGVQATSYWLYVGTAGVGSSNIFSQAVASTSVTVNGLPTNGAVVYVRLWSLVGGTWFFNDYLYTAAGATCASVLTPLPNSTLSGTTVSFNWSPLPGATQYWLYAGTGGTGSSNIFNSSLGTSTSVVVNNLPSDGSQVSVRLWALRGGSWCFTDQTYGGFHS